MENPEQSYAANTPQSAIAPVLQNLKQVLTDEKEHLASGRLDKLEDYARKKMQALAQINLYTRNDEENELARTNEVELRQIDELLRDNMKKLNFRITAIGEITETIRIAVKEAESDGTYKPGSYHIRRKAS